MTETSRSGGSTSNQNALGDCWLMATMGAMAVQNPDLVEEMIRENSNGTYTVTFPGREPITVAPDFPLDANGDLAFAGSREHPPVIWPAVLEKAYAQLKGNNYGNLENWHAGAAMDLFAGGAGLDYVPSFTGTDIGELAAKFDGGRGHHPFHSAEGPGRGPAKGREGKGRPRRQQ